MMLGNSIGISGLSGRDAHLASKGVEVGMTPDDLRITYLIFGICGIFWRLGGGVLGDKFETLKVFVVGMFLLECCNLGVGLAENGTILTICLASMVITSGHFIALSTPMMTELFGVMRIVKVMRVMFPMTSLLLFLSSVLLEAIRNASGGSSTDTSFTSSASSPAPLRC